MISIDHLVGFVTGVGTAVVGKYVADILTDRRREKEATRVSEDDFTKLSDQMPKLFAEMRKDLADQPLCRDFVLLQKSWIYNSARTEVTLKYYFEEHDSLKEKVGILENKGYVEDITFNNVDRFSMTENFVNLLNGSRSNA